MSWTVEFLDERVLKEMSKQPRDIRARFERIVALIKSDGLEQVHEPYVKHLRDKIWEIRLKGKDGIARALYVTATGKRLVVVRVFRKKTQKTPAKEIELAAKRAEEVA